MIRPFRALLHTLVILVILKVITTHGYKTITHVLNMYRYNKLESITGIDPYITGEVDITYAVYMVCLL